MFSLEQLANEHHNAHRPTADQPWRVDAEGYVRAVAPQSSLDWHRPSITMRFAALAANMSGASGAADTLSFYLLKKTRDRMLHGTQSEAPDGATTQVARDLALRYNKLFTLAAAP